MGAVKKHVLNLYFPIPPSPPSLQREDFSRIKDPQLGHREPPSNMATGGSWFSSFLTSSRIRRGIFEGIESLLLPVVLHLELARLEAMESKIGCHVCLFLWD